MTTHPKPRAPTVTDLLVAARAVTNASALSAQEILAMANLINVVTLIEDHGVQPLDGMHSKTMQLLDSYIRDTAEDGPMASLGIHAAMKALREQVLMAQPVPSPRLDVKWWHVTKTGRSSYTGKTTTREDVVKGDVSLYREEGFTCTPMVMAHQLMELRVCEHKYVVPRPGRSYLYTVDPKCADCVAIERTYAENDALAAEPSPAS